MAQFNPISALKDLRFVLFTLLFIALLLTGIYFAGKYAGKQKTSKRVKVPEDLDGDAGAYFDPGPITDAFHEDIYAGALAFRNIKPYEEAITLSNAKLAILMNDWQDRYYKKDQESLREALEGESKQWGATGRFVPLKEALVRKMIQIESISA